MTSSAKAIIVGGGIAGLVAAIRLAQSGVGTTLFEAASEAGGRARTRRTDGFSLNQGAHALYAGGAFHRTLKEFGVAVRGQKINPAAPQALHDGRLHRLPSSLGSLASTTLFGMRERAEFAKAQKAILDGATADGSFAHWLDTRKLRPRARAAVEAIARVTTYANGPDYMSAAAVLDQIRIGLKGVMYVDEGWGSIVDALRRVATDAGVDIRLGSGVGRAHVENGRKSILLETGEEIAAGAILLAVGPRQAAELAPGIGSLAQFAADAIPARANSLDLALQRWPMRAHEFVLGMDVPIYFSLHSKAAKLAPEGGAVVHVARYLSPDEPVRPDAIEELEAVADLAMPGWRALEKRRQTLRGIVVSNAMVRWDKPRPDVELPDAPGVFIAGDWVGREGMISDAAAASAVKAADAMASWLQGVEARSAA